jgi:hypothetical protein
MTKGFAITAVVYILILTCHFNMNNKSRESKGDLSFDSRLFLLLSIMALPLKTLKCSLSVHHSCFHGHDGNMSPKLPTPF